MRESGGEKIALETGDFWEREAQLSVVEEDITGQPNFVKLWFHEEILTIARMCLIPSFDSLKFWNSALES